MENIEIFKKKLINDFAKRYYNKTKNKLTEFELKRCSLLAEFWAYVHSVIPEGFGDYTIFDFNGCAINRHDKTVTNNIIPGVALSAKDKICRYCWGTSWKNIKQERIKNHNTNVFLKNKNIMLKRRKRGSNIIIYGLSDKPIGRTMLASIIMKEAIRLRVSNLKRGQTYDWIDFSKLFDAINKDTIGLVDYKTCDWLVVDNILKKPRSVKQNTFWSDTVDPFFLERLYNRQPTILVFKFDIRDKSFDMEKIFGIGISRIIHDKRTFKIPLCKESLEGIYE